MKETLTLTHGESLTQTSNQLPMIKKLFVGNLSFTVTEPDLQELFAQHGLVKEVHLMLDRASGRPRGFAFVEMQTAQDAEAAIAALHGKEFEGRALTVNIARPREERASGGRGRARLTEAQADEGDTDTNA
jgi:RNA recognition motif-containing protein